MPRGREENRFFNAIDVDRTLRIAAVDVSCLSLATAVGPESALSGSSNDRRPPASDARNGSSTFDQHRVSGASSSHEVRRHHLSLAFVKMAVLEVLGGDRQ